MEVLKKTQIKQTGRMIMIYGPTGVGKTCSALATTPDPILYVQTEKRPLRPSLDAINKPDLKIAVALYKEWEEFGDFIMVGKNTEAYATIVLDSITHLMNIDLTFEAQDEAYGARTKEEAAKKPFTSKVKTSLESRGAVNQYIFRTLNRLGVLAADYGKNIIIIALDESTPKWNRALAAAPALGGREVPNNFPGFFDLIGLVEPRTDDDGNMIYPPWVRFESPDGDFTAKFTGVKKSSGPAQGPLDFRKILSADGKEEK